MPYHAAKAIAATFCYEIRWALTPVFGNDFPSICLQPKDPGFGKFVIDPSIVQYCAAETNRFRTEGVLYSVSALNTSSPVKSPKNPFGSLPWGAGTMKQRSILPVDMESGYGTDSDKSDKYLFSPQFSPRNQCTWVSANRSPSPVSSRIAKSSTMGSPVSTQTSEAMLAVASATGEHYDATSSMKRTHSKVAFGDTYNDETLARPQTASTVDVEGDQGLESVRGDQVYSQSELEAAELLMMLSAVDRSLPASKRTRRESQD